MSVKQQVLEQLTRPVVEGLGFIFWGLEYIPQGNRSLLRIYIDHEEGIDVEDCATVSRQISSVLDVEDPIQSNYTLEVSSPGMDRVLFTLEQFAVYKGHEIEIRLSRPFEGRKKFKGLLNGVEDSDVLLVIEEEEYVLPFEQIEKARIIPRFDQIDG
ncbi:ribosome maturation factor RimP [Gynuella sp.]|uniref:ribosome maturation factor RimP n=1 Tax=Gynuella sp. TaxID=2969146 RepID=UPI003D141EF6